MEQCRDCSTICVEEFCSICKGDFYQTMMERYCASCGGSMTLYKCREIMKEEAFCLKDGAVLRHLKVRDDVSSDT